MAGIKDRVSAALHKDQTHSTHDNQGIHGSSGVGGTGIGGTTAGGMHSSTGGIGSTTGGMHSTTGGMHSTSGAMHSTSGIGMTGGSVTQGRGELVGGSPVIIDSKTFTKTEDHEVLIEKKAYELQHRPVEKEYVVETRYVGEQRIAGGPTELVGTEAREIEERVVEAPRGDRAVVVENVDVPREVLQQGTHLTGTHGSAHGTSASGSTYGTSASGTPGSTHNTTSF